MDSDPRRLTRLGNSCSPYKVASVAVSTVQHNSHGRAWGCRSSLGITCKATNRRATPLKGLQPRSGAHLHTNLFWNLASESGQKLEGVCLQDGALADIGRLQLRQDVLNKELAHIDQLVGAGCTCNMKACLPGLTRTSTQKKKLKLCQSRHPLCPSARAETGSSQYAYTSPVPGALLPVQP